MADLVAACGFHHIEGADNVRREIGVRVFERIAHARLRGEMDDRIGLEGIDHLVDPLAILEHRLGRLERLVLQQDLMTATLQIDVVIVGHAVETGDLETLGEQQFGKVKSNETGCSGHENFTAHAFLHREKMRIGIERVRLHPLAPFRGAS